MTTRPNGAMTGAMQARAPALRRLADYFILTKPGISTMVMLSTLTGFVVGHSGRLNAALLVWTVLGTGLVSAGAATMNMLWERREDGLMTRTKRRPLPAGRVSSAEAFAVGLLCGCLGLVMLSMRVNPSASLLAALSFLLYVFIYTPLKKVSRISVLVGAVCGAIPPLVGSAAAGPHLVVESWALFSAMLLWQLPHVAAIHFLQQKEFERAGFVRFTNDSSSRLYLVLCAVLPAGLLAFCGIVPAVMGAAGPVLAFGAVFLAAFVARSASRFVREKTMPAARRLFFATLIYLPSFFGIMMVDYLL
ncbi:MAG: heme o synthase [bacterium]